MRHLNNLLRQHFMSKKTNDTFKEFQFAFCDTLICSFKYLKKCKNNKL